MKRKPTKQAVICEWVEGVKTGLHEVKRPCHKRACFSYRVNGLHVANLCAEHGIAAAKIGGQFR